MCLFIEDDVLKLIPYTQEDIRLMYNCFKDKQTQLGFNYIISTPYEDYARTVSIDYYRFWAVIVHKKSNRKIGSLRLSPFESNPDLSIFLLRRYRGRGYGTRAYSLGLQYCFNALGMTEVVAGCYEHNHISKRMLEKLNFERVPSHDILERSVFTGEQVKQHGYRLHIQRYPGHYNLHKQTADCTID